MLPKTAAFFPDRLEFWDKNPIQKNAQCSTLNSAFKPVVQNTRIPAQRGATYV